MKRSQAITAIGAGLVAVLIFLVGFGAWKFLISNKTQEATVTPQLDAFVFPLFAEYRLENTQVTASVPETNIQLSQLTNISNFEKKDTPFSTAERNYLQSNNFVVRPNLDQFYSVNPDDPTQRSDDWTGLYRDIGGYSIFTRAPENSVFISTDYLLHVYHKLIEKELQYIEQSLFIEKLADLSQKLFYESVKFRDITEDAEDKASFDRLTTFFAVPTAMLKTVEGDVKNQIVGDSVNDNLANAEQQLELLKSQMSEEAYDRAKAELKLIFDHQEITAPPLFEEPNSTEGLNITEDYTQYTPRSHYTKNAMLRSYFRTMMWYGRTNFLAKSKALTLDALHITQLMYDDTLQQTWKDIYLPTAFIVGPSDDLGWPQYQEVVLKAQITSDNITDRQLQNSQLLISLLPKPQVMSSVIIGEEVFDQTKEELQASTQGFRFFGQRFTPDAFIFTTLTQGDEKPDPETGEKLPSNTTGLLVMSAMGSATADQFVPEWILNNAPNSQQVLNNRLTTLKTKFSALDQQQWTQNMYWSWLYTLQSLFTNYETLAGYPAFMKSPNWKIKNLQTAMGSWTELKHDTLLYSKQSYAEMGAGGDIEPPPVPKGYVEPNVPFYDRILALSTMTQEGLKNSGVLPQEFEGRHQTFDEVTKFFREIAVKQLENQIISDDDFEKLRYIGGTLDTVVRPLPNEESIESNARSAIIADVHTDVPGAQILYEATGIPNYIYVAISDTNGTRLTKGLTYNHFEFTEPLGSRQNDQDWQQKNYPPKDLPPHPFWVRDLYIQ